MQANKDIKRKDSIFMQIVNIIKETGIEGLYFGVYAKLVQTILYNAFLMVIYERLRLLVKYLLMKKLQSMNRKL